MVPATTERSCLVGHRDTEFTGFVVERRQVLLRTAYLLCGSWTQAEDVVQIALSKLYVAWPRVQPTSGAYAYARQIVARTAVDEWRRPWRREVVGGAELLVDAPERDDVPEPAHGDDPDAAPIIDPAGAWPGDRRSASAGGERFEEPLPHRHPGGGGTALGLG